MHKITTMLWFDGQAEEAMTFYTSVFKNSKAGKVARYPKGAPGGMDGQVMTAEFEINGSQFVALNAGPLFKFNESVSFVIYCDTQEEIDYYWNTLTADGGEESMCGWLKDKFGLSWQVTPTQMSKFMTGDKEGAQRAMQAMMQMRKFDMEAMQAAYDGK